MNYRVEAILSAPVRDFERRKIKKNKIKNKKNWHFSLRRSLLRLRGNMRINFLGCTSASRLSRVSGPPQSSLRNSQSASQDAFSRVAEARREGLVGGGRSPPTTPRALQN